MGQFDVHYIIDVAIPALMFIYPITIVLILLNILPEKYATQKVFRWVVAVTVLFSVPDFLGSLGLSEWLGDWVKLIPLGQFHMGWVLPALLTFVIVNIASKERNG